MATVFEFDPKKVSSFDSVPHLRPSSSVTLSPSVELPRIGFGVYQIVDEKECESSVSDALEVGYRAIDTATLYANERSVGRAIAASGIPRDQLCVTTKVWHSQNFYEGAKLSVESSLEKLGLDYLDLVLIHQPFNDIYGAWRALEELYDSGLVRAIGVSNFYPARLADLIDHVRIKPSLNQVEAHVLYQQHEAQKYMDSVGVVMQAWAPLARAREDVFSHPVLVGIAQQYDKTVAQVILRWLLQRGIVIIPKTTHKARMVENFDIFDFNLSTEQVEAINALDAGVPLFGDHRELATAQRLLGRTVSL